MKISELRELSTDELNQKLVTVKKELFDLRMQQAGGKLSSPHKLRYVRRDVARILTLLKQEQGGNQAEEAK